MSKVREHLEQLKRDLENHTIYKEGLPGSALDIVNVLLADLEEDEKENGWIPVKFHKVSKQEREEKFIPKDVEWITDSQMPKDGQEILVTNGEDVWSDMCIIDSYECYLDSGQDWGEILFWRPSPELPKPHKEDAYEIN